MWLLGDEVMFKRITCRTQFFSPTPRLDPVRRLAARLLALSTLDDAWPRGGVNEKDTFHVALYVDTMRDRSLYDVGRKRDTDIGYASV